MGPQRAATRSVRIRTSIPLRESRRSTSCEIDRLFEVLRRRNHGSRRGFVAQTSKETYMAASNNPKRDPDPGSNTEKPPEDWVTRDEKMTGAQASYLKTLCEEAGEEFDPNLTKAEASRRIDELKAKTDRGT
jgi:hypothetical protein